MATNNEPTTTLTVADPAVTRLIELHDATVRAVRTTIENAIESGSILATIRATFPARAAKGAGFGDWVEQNLPYSKRIAWGYIKAYNERDKWLANPDATVRRIFGHHDDEQATTTADDHADEQATDGADPEPLNPNDEVVTLTPAQHKRAERMASYFGVPLQRAIRYVRDQTPRKRTTTTTTDEPTLAKRTIRVTPELDDHINTVARTTNRSYAVVANELFDIGRKRFVRRYNLNDHD
jgi:predicted transcriptional regulator